jgi:hypothetical protein
VAEYVPLPLVRELRGILLEALMPPRISADLHRGLLLESTHRVVQEHLLPLLSTGNLAVSLIVHANLYLLKRDLALTEPSKQPLEEEDEGLDLSKTGERLWGLVTTGAAQYTSVLEFIDESIPRLKLRQQEDLVASLGQRLYQTAQHIHAGFLQQALGNVDDETAPASSLERVGSLYQWLREQVAHIQGSLGYADGEGLALYEALKTDVRVKAISRVQEYYGSVERAKGAAYVEELRERGVFKGVREINAEVFRCCGGGTPDTGRQLAEGELFQM